MAGTPGGPGSSAPGQVDVDEAPLEDTGFAERYDMRAMLGQGGMGEVHLCKDRRIGREVAIKVARAANGSRGDQVARFAREARVQGQLEHPAIVPVYDLGRRPDGAVFFTMKRVRGLTLARIIEGLRRDEADVVHRYSRRKLLTAFGSVCQAVHFAHTRGVLHRDLKPGNVMLGDFGEVYVLDWGLAKLGGELDETPAAEASAAERIDATSAPGPETALGALMGTPGFMAPEQVRGEAARADARIDVYALGALLYELLTWQPLHCRDTPQQAIASTLAGADACATVRAPEREVPPELEAVCVRATALAPVDRYAGARELFDAIEAFLDGDRDLERRRELATHAALAAEAAADRALGGGGDPERREALQQAGRALALDPENAAAMRAMVRLLLAPPAQLPAEVARDIERREIEMVRLSSIKGGWSFMAWFLFVPLLFWLGLRDLRPLVAWMALVGTASAFGFLGPRLRLSQTLMHFFGLGLTSAAIVLMSGLAGPFVIVPLMASLTTLSFLFYSRRSVRVPTLIIGSLTMALPIIAEALGWTPRTTWFIDDTIVIRSWAVHLPEVPTMVVLGITLVGCMVVPALYLMRVRDALSAAERQMHLQSWHLRQLIPAEARDALAPRAGTDDSLLECPIDRASR